MLIDLHICSMEHLEKKKAEYMRLKKRMPQRGLILEQVVQVNEFQPFLEGKGCCKCRAASMRVLQICDTGIGPLDQSAVSQLEDTVPVFLTDIAVTVSLLEYLLIQDDIIWSPTSCLRGTGEDQLQADMGMGMAQEQDIKCGECIKSNCTSRTEYLGAFFDQLFYCVA